jgi:hypothetical protein
VISRRELCEVREELREVLESRRALAEVALEPAQRRLLVLRRPAISVELHELEGVLERYVRELPGSVRWPR